METLEEKKERRERERNSKDRAKKFVDDGVGLIVYKAKKKKEKEK
jgi:hypothetical protein